MRFDPVNKQPVHKQNLDPGGVLHVHSVFPTIQGEGPYSGQPAVFVRLFGCNLQCSYCDTDYTSKTKLYSPQRLFKSVESLATPNALVVITGGEPFRQNIAPFVSLLVKEGYTVQIETNGSLHLPDLLYEMVTVVCSPKTGAVNPKLSPYISAYKYVLYSNSVSADDGLPERALAHPAKPRLARPPKDFEGPIYVQPEDSNDQEQNKRNLEAAIKSCMTFGYTLCLQIHKIIDME